MKILLTGKTGQIGEELNKIVGDLGNLITVDKEQLDLSKPNSIEPLILDIKPDIIISSKCLTAGYFPMGAVIVNKEFSDEFTSVSEDAEEFPHGFTAGGHPVGCAIALKAIDVIINEGLLENVRTVSPYFHERLNEF